MKIQLLIITAAVGLSGLQKAQAQIPNNDFENWTTLSQEKPEGWTLALGISKLTDKKSGNYSVKLQGDTKEESPGVVLLGQTDEGDVFWGGAPFTARPDSIIFWAKYNIANGDSAMFYLQLKKLAQPITARWYKFNGVSNNFVRMAFKIDYTAAGNPDSIILGFVSTNVFEEVNGNSWLQLDDVSFSGTTQNVPNPGFEGWKNLVHYTPNHWASNYDNEDLLDETKPTILRSFDAGTGGACLHIRNINRGDWIQSGETRTIKNMDDQWSFGPAFPVSGKPDTLYGLYKWLPKNGDNCAVRIYMYKEGNMVGQGVLSTSTAQTTWAIAKVPINYFSMDSPDPDSAQIELKAYYNSDAPEGESDLYVDNLSFSPIFGAGTKNPFAIQFSVKPNPASETINVQLPATKNSSTARIYDATGRLVLTSEISAMNPAIQLSSLPAGTYSIRLDGLFGSRKFVKQ